MSAPTRPPATHLGDGLLARWLAADVLPRDPTRRSEATGHLHEEARAVLLAAVEAAARPFAPLWPLTDLVAVNPLGGLQALGFEAAAQLAGSELGARAYLPLARSRELHAAGRIPEETLRRTVRELVPELGAAPGLSLPGLELSALDVVLIDLLSGPEPPAPDRLATVGERAEPALPADVLDAIDAVVAAWCAVAVDDAVAAWRLPDGDRGLFAAWRRHVRADRRVRDLVGRRGRRWLAALPDDPVIALDRGLHAAGVAPRERAVELRAQLARLPGWAGYARWCDGWAEPGDPRARLRSVELLAVRVALEAAALGAAEGIRPVVPVTLPVTDDAALTGPDHARVDAVVRALGIDPAGATPSAALLAPTDGWPAFGALPTADAVTAGSSGAAAPRVVEPAVVDACWGEVRRILTAVPEPSRQRIWLEAHETVVRDELLTTLAAPATVTLAADDDRPPAAQVLTCIDVRSEVLRRHLEAAGPYRTYGVAGFFGVAARWRPLGSDHAEPRAPVLVSPSHEIRECPAPGAERRVRTRLGAAGLRRSVGTAVHAARGDLAAPFVYAESAGWLLGPAAALRTLVPPASPRSARRRAGVDATSVDLHGQGGGGFTLDDRVALASGLLRTVGLTSGFAPLVLLCGHAASTVNNAHAATLDCGACGGAPGGASARIAAGILNDPEVRARLADEGIVVPPGTVFLAGEHDTTADQVAILDRTAVPAWAAARVAALEGDLEVAGAQAAAERARRLPGDPTRVRARGRDWAEVRPEWGLARNTAIIVAPREVTAGRDLDGRTFLHSYDDAADHDGSVLTAILTAPVVVAQWINAQYHLSSVDPELLGAGDKLLHNPVAGIGVVTGDGGDLRVGLPWQSVAVGEQLVHEPVRLHVLVQAPLARIEAVIAASSTLAELVEGGWVHLLAREDDHGRWAVRGRAGGWCEVGPLPAAAASGAGVEVAGGGAERVA